MKDVGTALLGPDQPGLNRLLLAGFVVSILVLIATAALSTWNHQQLVFTHRKVMQTQRLLGQMAELRAGILEARDAQRGFIITGQESFLTAYTEATNRLAALLSPSDEFVGKEPLREFQFDRLKALAQQVIDVFNAHIEARRTKGFDAAAELVSTQEVQEYLEPLQDLISGLSDTQRDQLAQREERSAQAESLAFWFNNSGRVLTITLFAGVFFGLLRENQLRRQRENELRRSGAELERRVTERTGELREKNKELETVVYIVSHDLRSPLLNVQGFAKRLGQSCQQLRELLMPAATDGPWATGGKPLLEQRIPESLEFIQAGVRRMDQLLSGFLRYSRLGRVTLNIVPLDPNQLIAGILETMRYQIEQAGAAIETEPLPHCLGDATQCTLVFSNLLDNALKYRDPGRLLRVKITGRQEGDHSVYCLADNGVGIEPNHQQRVFEIFHRLNPDHCQGEGLGLTIAQRLLERQQGRIWVESQAGVGSCFCVALPHTKTMDSPQT